MTALQTYCQRKLKSAINEDNVGDILEGAARLGLEDLRTFAVNQNFEYEWEKKKKRMDEAEEQGKDVYNNGCDTQY